MFEVGGQLMRRIRPTGWIVIAAVFMLLLVWGIRASGSEHVPDLDEMKLEIPSKAFLPAALGENWVPGQPDADGYIQVDENKRFVLYLDPAAGGGIAVRNKQSGYLWRSSPTAEQLAGEKVKGLLLSNLKSPFILEYHEAGKTQRQKVNAADKNMTIGYQRAASAVQVDYSLPKLKLSFAIRYTLTGEGLEVSVPSQSIREEGSMFIVSLQVLPFFGAVQSGGGDSGYLFVPDGPGGLIHFDDNRTPGGKGYRYPLYGSGLTGNTDAEKVRQTSVAYPVFGLKRGNDAFVAVMKSGQYESYVTAQPAGIVSSFNAVSVEWVYRNEYGQRLSKLSAPVNTIERERLDRDRTVEYRLLSGSDVGYVEMAASYRSYLQDAGRLPGMIGPGEKIPLELTLLGGNSGKAAFGSRYAAATTFKQAEAMVGELKEGGVERMNIILQGWEKGGDRGQPDIFPVEQALGGSKGAEAFIDRMHESGYKVLFEHGFVWYDEAADGISARTDGIRSMDGTVLLMDGDIAMAPARSAGRAYQAVNELKQLGADGILFGSYGSLLYHDRNQAAKAERDDTAALFESVMRYAQRQLGSASVNGGYDYTLGSVDGIARLPFETSYDMNVDETVPFYPIVLHGSLPYSFSPGNLRDRYDEELLKSIEYGAVPSFVLTYEPSINIRYTLSNDLYSTHFTKWKDRVIAEYGKFVELSSVYDQMIVGHRKKAEGIYITTYANGIQVEVDYKTLTFRVDKEDSNGRSR
ncbi:DUF5696 domain-containing protein [Paenibacillus nasutitermitis]|uniref:Uncharacterized protein n=1 Tax=Paenibacillus nasutitermitis TaxID=1652958 RepID=A0A917DQJ4_9BACL|nr:DUF5696 domain-containing protein [Paenibacillus nasutitermitis]GGD57278.1 hypothetical protein GCM10010911_13820 [Paenibacillus nasutitermitis]